MKFCILDFDDTLFPTSFAVSPLLSEEKKRLNESVSNLVSSCLKAGYSVVIITNGSEEWVEHAITEAKLDSLKNITVISATHRYSSKNIIWCKIRAFFDFLKSKCCIKEEKYEKNEKHEILSIGDGEYEQVATKYISEKLKNIIAKIIRIPEKPSFEGLLLHQRILTELLEKLGSYPHSLEINLSCLSPLEIIKGITINSSHHLDGKYEISPLVESRKEDEEYYESFCFCAYYLECPNEHCILKGCHDYDACSSSFYDEDVPQDSVPCSS